MNLLEDLLRRIRVPLLLVLILTLSYEAQIRWLPNPGLYGIHPRDLNQWWGIFTMPFLHGSTEHLLSNLISFTGLGCLLFVLYYEIAGIAMLLFWLLTGSLMFFMGRPQFYHLGASGVVYAMMSFLIVIGFLVKGRPVKSVAIAVILFYGSAVWGFLPMDNGVSWDGHLAGAFAGAITAFLLRKKARALYSETHEIVQEEEDVEEDEYERFG